MYSCHDFGFKDEESVASRDELTFLRTLFISGITKIWKWTLCFDSPDYLTWLTYLSFSVLLYVPGGWPMCVPFPSGSGWVVAMIRDQRLGRERLDSVLPQFPAWGVTTDWLHPFIEDDVSCQLPFPYSSSICVLETTLFPSSLLAWEW